MGLGCVLWASQAILLFSRSGLTWGMGADPSATLAKTCISVTLFVLFPLWLLTTIVAIQNYSQGSRAPPAGAATLLVATALAAAWLGWKATPVLARSVVHRAQARWSARRPQGYSIVVETTSTWSRNVVTGTVCGDQVVEIDGVCQGWGCPNWHSQVMISGLYSQAEDVTSWVGSDWFVIPAVEYDPIYHFPREILSDTYATLDAWTRTSVEAFQEVACP
jgi:hypothetical protein